jgi:ribosome-associated translation inhibitor RaiA
MVIHVVYHGFSPTPAVMRALDEARTGLEDTFSGLVSVEWALETEGSEAEVACRVHARAGYFRATARSHDVGQALREVIDRLEQQRRRRKDALTRRRRLAAKKRT